MYKKLDDLSTENENTHPTHPCFELCIYKGAGHTNLQTVISIKGTVFTQITLRKRRKSFTARYLRQKKKRKKKRFFKTSINMSMAFR